ncbi:MAG TPA: hypothetical protein VKT49_23890 [Bryobacteraceae bacterium]|nr:hypothetical protein [Bryobacteraceae bacterium]
MKWIRLPGFGAVVLALSASAAEPGFHAQFVGGTVSGVAAKSKAHLDLSGIEALVLRGGEAAIRIDYRKISTLEYGQNVSRRFAEAILISPVLLLSKSRKHFVTIGYQDEAGQQQALVLRLDKGDIRSALASLEARTGRRVEYQDAEARKAGR